MNHVIAALFGISALCTLLALSSCDDRGPAPKHKIMIKPAPPVSPEVDAFARVIPDQAELARE